MPTATATPGTFASEAFTGSTDAWASPSNAGASDNTYTTAAVNTGGDKSEYLKCTNCSFSIPANASIQGIEVLVEWSHSGGGTGTAKQYRNRIVKAGVVSSDTTYDSSSALASSDTTGTLGSSSGLWGTTWTPDDINASTFGCAIACQSGSGSLPSARIDRVQIRVTYQFAIGIVAEREYPLPLTLSTSGPDVEIFAGVAFTADSSPTDLSDRLQTLRVTRGRPFNLDRVDAGTASLRFTNLDGELDPSNADGTYYGTILPLRATYLYRRISDVTYWLHKGRVERYLPEWAPPNAQFMSIESADVFEQMATQIIESAQATLTTTLTGSNNDLTFTAVDAGESGDQISVTYTVAGTDTALDTGVTDPFAGTTAVVTAEVSNYFTNRGGFRWNAIPTGSKVPVTVAVSGGDIVVTVATNGGGSATSTAAEIKTALEVNTDVTKLVSIANAPGSDGSGVVTAMAKTNLSGGTWAAETSGDRIDRVLDLIGWPAGSRDIDTGIYTMCARGFGRKDNVSAISHIQDIAESELGYCFVTANGVFTFHDGQHRATASRSTTSQATFSNDGTGVPIVYGGVTQSLDKDRIVNEVTVTGGLSTSVAQTVSDATSQTTYGLRTLSRSTQLASDTDALAVAQAILDSYKDAVVRFEEIRVLRTAATSGWDDAVLGREIGDLVTIRLDPPTHDTIIAYDAYIEEITLEWSPGQPIAASFRLTAASESTTPGGGGGGGGAGALYDSSGDELLLDDATAGILG